MQATPAKVTPDYAHAGSSSGEAMFWRLPAAGIVRRETADFQITVERAEQGRSLILQVGETFRPDRKERVVLLSPWGPEIQALVTFATPPRDGVCTGRISALFSPERPILESFVNEVLGGAPPKSKFGNRGPGWFLWVEPAKPTAVAVAAPAAKPAEPDPSSRRREPRVPVRVAVTCAINGRLVKGRAYNISESGLYLLARVDKSRLPKEGEIVRVRYPVTVHIKPVELVVTGDVCWCGEATEGKGVYGIGLKISEFNDPSDAAIWSRYVANELHFRPERVRVVTEKA